MGGRDRERLEAVRRDLGAPAEIVVADALDGDAMAAMARRTHAVVSTVGPYARYGTPLVAACADAGTDYADLTAEALWMRSTVDAFHDRAVQSGARIVHACGFDSLPSDLGTWRLHTEALQRYGRPCRQVVHAFGPMAGGLSGGTVASAFDLIAQAARDPETRRALMDPDLLAPGAPASPDPLGPWWPQRHAGLDGWTTPFVMAASNAKVVRRTRALLGEPWGDDVRYLERLRVPTWARAATVGLMSVAAPVLLAPAFVRRLAAGVLPEPGQGPSEAVRKRGYFRSTLVGHVDGVREPVVGHTRADLDPGYGATARMLAEVGLGLAQREFDVGGGVLTPAVVGGQRLVDRLGEVGIRIGT
ncbi:MAG: saccharopine dehydrogenase NADP-binding domain-containing protein [Trueperaceae bacterium]|nr:saccharopine dehydrogenase NADP-binding domain-containing protein [Trueperaceae bacterium]